MNDGNFKYLVQNNGGELEDVRNLPSLIIPDKLHDIFLLDGIEEYRKNLDTYTFNGLPVPRVSTILKECISKEYLINWAAKIGKQQYAIERNKATTIGSRVHEMIEHYLLYHEDLDLSFKIAPSYLPSVLNAYNNFKEWVKYLNSNGYYIEKIIAIEKEISCPYYGGTIDCICQINGKIYIIDFKTSKQISYEYIIQTCAYMWMVNHGYCPDIPHIDGIGIIRIDKEKKKFEDLFLNESIPEQNNIINQFFMGFGSLLSSYYHNINMRYLFSQYKKDYNLITALEG